MKKFICLVLTAAMLSTSVFAFSPEDISKNRFLISTTSPLDSEYIPPNLMPLMNAGVKVTLAAIQLNEQAASFAKAMISAMEADGVTDYVVVSGYRRYSSQKNLFDNRVASYLNQGYSQEEAEAATASIIAIPGTSEHQSGYAVDISNSYQGGTLTSNIENSPAGAWFLSNMHEYGYTLRFPKDKTEITGITYEPWHYRYVGLPHSEILYNMDLCLEEYVDYLRDGEVISHTDKDGIAYSVYYSATIEELPEELEVSGVWEIGNGGYIVVEVAHEKEVTPFRWK